MKQSGLYTFIVIICLALSSVSVIAQDDIDRTLRINIGGQPETLDPTLMRGSVEFRLITGLMEGLIRIDDDGTVVPATATSWEHNESHDKWTFHLRENAKWHNGDPVTAHDFVYAIKRICTPSLSAPYAGTVYGFLQGGEEYYEAGGLDSDATFPGVEAIDDYTLVFRLVGPTPYFDTVVYLFSWLPLNKNVIDEHGENWWQEPDTFVGNGPFKLTVNRGYDRAEGIKADTYWDAENIFWEKVIWRFIESETTELAAFQTGDLDVTTSVPIPEIELWKDKQEYRPHTFFGTYYVTFNNSAPPFDNVHARKAFSKAINRKIIVERVTKRNEPISRGLIPGHLQSAQGGTWADHTDNLIGSKDIDAAREHLKKAGYGPENTFPEIEYLFNTKEEHKSIAEFLQFQIKSGLGIDMRLQNQEWGAWLQNTRKGNFTIARMSWYGDYLDAMTFLELFTSDSTQNVAHFKDPHYDQLVEKARLEEDAVEREKLLMKAESYLIGEQCAIMPLFTYQYPMLVKSTISGVSRNTLGGLNYVYGKRK